MYQLSMSQTVGEGPGGPTPSPVGHGTASCGLLVLPQENFPVLTSTT